MRSVFFTLAILVGCAAASPSQAARIQLLDAHPEGCTARLTGQIVKGDAARLREILRGPDGAERYVSGMRGITLCFDSPGGSFLEGLHIARDLRTAGIASHVAAGETCLSACALAFLGGSRLSFEDAITHEFRRSLHATARLGFHAPKLDIPAGSFTEGEVDRAFRLALRASAMIFTRLEELGISRAFALAFFDVPEGTFYEIDTPERVDEADVAVTGLAPLPLSIPPERQADLCARTFEIFDQRRYEDPDNYTKVLVRDHISLPAERAGTQRAAHLIARTGEGTLMWDVCVMTWWPDQWQSTFALRLAHDRLFDFDPYDFRNPVPPTQDSLLRQLGEQPQSRASLRPLLAAPAGTPLEALATDAPPAVYGSSSPATCAPVRPDYKVVNVQSFTNLRAAPGFEADVLRQVRKDARVAPVTPGTLEGTALLSQRCRMACQLSKSGQVKPDDLHTLNACASSDAVWWQVRTTSGTTGWLATKFLAR